MRSRLLLLRKLRAEVGLNFFRLVPSIGSVIVHTLQGVCREIDNAFSADRVKLLQDSKDHAGMLDKARFVRRIDDGPALPVFREIKSSDRPDRWRWTSSRLALLATMEWPDVGDAAEHLGFLLAKPDGYFRYHELNKGANDHWEYYLVPWHRSFCRLSVALLDDRLRSILMPIWHRYDHWNRTEKPWMTRICVGSNISSVLTGYSMFGLMGYLLAEAPDDKIFYLDRYIRYGKRLHKALYQSYDTASRASVPYEGVLYGSFWWRSTVILGLLQRQLGLNYCVLDEPSCRGISEYVWSSRTPDGDYQTSGDSKPWRNGSVPEDNVFATLSAALEDPYAGKLADIMAVPYFMRDRLRQTP